MLALDFFKHCPLPVRNYLPQDGEKDAFLDGKMLTDLFFEKSLDRGGVIPEKSVTVNERGQFFGDKRLFPDLLVVSDKFFNNIHVSFSPYRAGGAHPRR